MTNSISQFWYSAGILMFFSFIAFMNAWLVATVAEFAKVMGHEE